MRLRPSAVLFVIAALLAWSPATAGVIRVYNGCYTCTTDNAGNGSCAAPANNSWGDGSTCTETTSDSGPTTCQTSAGMCYYTEVGGGGTGGGGGHGDTGCSTYGVGECPADCSSCYPFY